MWSMVQQNYIHRLALGRSAFEPLTRREPNELGLLPDSIDRNSQRYDERGNPVNLETRTAARRLRRAQNDVYATIGVVVPTTSKISGKHKSKATDAAVKKEKELADAEHWTAIWLALGFKILRTTITSVVRNQRNRIHTFARYAGIPLTAIITSEFRHQDFLSYFLAGEATLGAYECFEVLSGFVTLTVPATIEALITRRHGEDHHTSLRTNTVQVAEQILAIATSFALAPTTAVVALQRLQLISVQPLVPWPHHSLKAAYLALLPDLPSRWTFQTVLRFCVQLPWSPAGLSLIMELLFSVLSSILTRYMREGLPRPDNPTQQLFSEVAEQGDDRWLIRDSTQIRGSFKEEFSKDLAYLSKTIKYYWLHLQMLFAPREVREHKNAILSTLLRSQQRMRGGTAHVQSLRSSMNNDGHLSDTEEIRLAEHEASLGQFRHEINELGPVMIDAFRSGGIMTPAATGNGTSVSEANNTFTDFEYDAGMDLIPAADPGTQRDRGDTTQPNPFQEEHRHEETGGPLNSHPVRSPGRPPSPATTSPSSSPPLEPTNVQVRTRSGSTSTLHMDVEVNQAAINGTTYTTSFSASPRTPVMETSVSQIMPEHPSRNYGLPHHRITSLSLLSSALLGQCLVQIAIQALLLPLESMYLRTLAQRFLRESRPDDLGSVYPIRSWFGVGTGLRQAGFGSAVDYSSKIATCLGIEMVLSTGCWYVASKTSYWLGRRWFAWAQAAQ